MKEETKMRTTAQVLVDCLEAEGVDVIFGIPGEETLDLMFAIRDSKIRFIPVQKYRKLLKLPNFLHHFSHNIYPLFFYVLSNYRAPC